MTYQATYKTEIVTENKIIRSDGFSSVSFENIGTNESLVNNMMPLYPQSGISRFFNEKPYVKINTDFSITFQSVENGISKVLVIFTYYNEII